MSFFKVASLSGLDIAMDFVFLATTSSTSSCSSSEREASPRKTVSVMLLRNGLLPVLIGTTGLPTISAKKIPGRTGIHRLRGDLRVARGPVNRSTESVQVLVGYAKGLAVPISAGLVTPRYYYLSAVS